MCIALFAPDLPRVLENTKEILFIPKCKPRDVAEPAPPLAVLPGYDLGFNYRQYLSRHSENFSSAD